MLSARAVNKAPSDRPRDLQTCVPRGRVRPRGEPSGGEASRSRPRRDRDLQPAGGSRHRASAQQRGPSRPRRLPSRTTRSPRDATDDEQDAALVILAGSAGLRMGELPALRWRHVYFQAQRLHIQRSYTAGDESSPKGRTVRLANQPAQPIARLGLRPAFTAPGDLVFRRTCRRCAFIRRWRLRQPLWAHGGVGRCGHRTASEQSRRQPRTSAIRLLPGSVSWLARPVPVPGVGNERVRPRAVPVN